MFEETNLALADRHSAEGEARHARQAALVERLREAGHDTVEAENLPRLIAESLDEMRTHRRSILAEPGKAGRGTEPPPP
jgi:hypothetical protein